MLAIEDNTKGKEWNQGKEEIGDRTETKTTQLTEVRKIMTGRGTATISRGHKELKTQGKNDTDSHWTGPGQRGDQAATPLSHP